MKHPILALVLASAPLIVLAAPASAPPVPAAGETYGRILDLPVVTIRARRMEPVSRTEPDPPKDVPSDTHRRGPTPAHHALRLLEQDLVATRIELAHVQLELARLRLELRTTLRRGDQGQCELAAASAPPQVP